MVIAHVRHQPRNLRQRNQMNDARGQLRHGGTVDHGLAVKGDLAFSIRWIVSSVSSTNSASTSGWYRVARTDLTAVSGPVALSMSSPG